MLYETGPGLLEILSPLPDSIVSGDECLELSLLLPSYDGLSLSVWLDGTDISRHTEITPDYAFYLSPAPLATGLHHILVIGIIGGDTLFSKAWSFTVAKALAIPETAPIPWEASLGLGWQYGTCDRDTAGLGLSYPIGHQPSGSVSFSSSLWSGHLQGNFSYDRTYDTEPHGLIQFARSGLEISLGEFYPDLSPLAFANAAPLGLMARTGLGRLSLDFTACRTVPADTAINSFAQYLYGGKAGWRLGDSLWLGLGCLRGSDQPSSLPDSVRFRSTTVIVADTIFGMTDTLVYVDSLCPAENRIVWLSLKKSLGRFSLGLEGAGTRTDYHYGGSCSGRGYLVQIGHSVGPWSMAVSYSSTDNGFRSFGNPYSETNKNELGGQIQAAWPGGQRALLQGNVFKAFNDSAPGLGWGLGTGGSLKVPGGSLTLRLDYSLRPYRQHLFQSRSLGAGLALSLSGFHLSSGYGYNSSSATIAVQSHSVSAEVSRCLYRRFVLLSLGQRYYRSRNAVGGSDTEKASSELSLSGDLTGSLSYRLQARRIKQTDRIDPARSCRQTIASASLTVQL